jgi:tetratricopeptide (TPR) repeat protein
VNEFIPTVYKGILEQILEQYGFILQYLALGYVVYVILHRRNFNQKKIRLKDPLYQSKKGVSYEKKFSRKDMDKQDELILDGSIRQFKYASMIDPKLPEPHYNLAIALLEKGQINESIVEFRKVISLNPEFAEAHNNLGIALSLNGEFDEAITSFEEALKINPDFVEAKNNLETAKEDKDGEYWARFGVR